MTRLRDWLETLDAPVVLLLLAGAAGLWPAFNRAAALPMVAVLWGGGLVYYLAGKTLRAQRLWLARGAVVAGGLVAILFLTQYGHYNPLEKVEGITRLGQLLAAPFPTLSFFQPVANGMATLLEGLLFLAAGLALAETRTGWRWSAGACAGGMALAVVISESRGAWLAVGGAALAWLAVCYRPARWLGLAALVGLAGLGAAVILAGDVTVLDRIPVVRTTLAPLFIRPDRLEVYRQSAALLKDTVYTGIGPGGQFAMAYSRYGLLIQVPFLTYAHNLFLETWLELGLAGMTALVWLIAGLAAMPRSESAIQAGARFGLLAVGLHGLTDARPYSDLWCWPAIFLLIGLAAGRGGQRRGWRLAGPLCALVFALAALLWTGAPRAAWLANLGAMHQTRAELSARLGESQKQAELASAEDLFHRALAIRPGLGGANLRLGLILSDREEFGAALPYLQAAYRADAGRIAAVKALGLGYIWVGDVEQAASVLKALPHASMVQELNDWGYWRMVVRKQEQLGKNAYRTSLLLEPNQPKVWELVGP